MKVKDLIEILTGFPEHLKELELHFESEEECQTINAIAIRENTMTFAHSEDDICDCNTCKEEDGRVMGVFN